MVLIPSQLNSTLTLNSQNLLSANKGFSLGQLLEANIQPSKGNEVKLTIGSQTFTAQTKEPITESGKIQVRVKQLTPEIQLSIVKNPSAETKGSPNQQTIQSAYRQFIPVQAPITQVFQQINLMQSLPPSLQQPLQTLINQLTKQDNLNDGKALKERFTNSGLFFESKLKTGLQNQQAPNVKNDVKAQLLQLQQQTDKIQLSDPKNSTLNKLSALLNQAISRITVQQIQIFENPFVTALNLPNEHAKQPQDDVIEIRKHANQDEDIWEVYVDLSLEQGSFSCKLKLKDGDQLSLFIWCENETLQTQVKAALSTLQARLSKQGFDNIQLQLTPQKPAKTEHSVKVALIDIKV